MTIDAIIYLSIFILIIYLIIERNNTKETFEDRDN